jgi:hypothetical protein
MLKEPGGEERCDEKQTAEQEPILVRFVGLRLDLQWPNSALVFLDSLSRQVEPSDAGLDAFAVPVALA